jgi:hypothetical protein
MSTIGKWKKHKFVVSSKKIMSFDNLQIKGGSTIEEKKKNKKPTVKRKSAKPLEISLTVGLNAYVGPNVRKEALVFVKEATNGAKGYFYVGKKKLMTCKLMLTDASVKNIVLSKKGSWVQAEVSLTLKQCTKGKVNVEGGGAGKKKGKKKGKGSNKSSVRSSSPVTRPSGGYSGGGTSSGSSSSGSKKPFLPYWQLPKPTPAPKREETKSANHGITAASAAARTASSYKVSTPTNRISGNTDRI